MPPHSAMIKRLKDFWERLRRERGRLKATVLVDFYPHKAACSSVDWHDSAPQEQDLVSLAIFFYARILYELAELNETRVANELKTFISQVAEVVLTGKEAPNRPRLPLGELQLRPQALPESPSRSYQAKLFRLQDGQFRLDFSGSLGKEGVYLPAAYVVFLQTCIEVLDSEALRRLAQSLKRLHDYYKIRHDFWEGVALTSGPTFALNPDREKMEAAEAEG
ncbi:MAG: hypothetical protein ACUVXF_06945 [Desulfobaccales bacterium]